MSNSGYTLVDQFGDCQYIFEKFALTIFCIRNFGMMPIFSASWAKVSKADIYTQNISNKVLKTISRITCPNVPLDLSELNHVTAKWGGSSAAMQ